MKIFIAEYNILCYFYVLLNYFEIPSDYISNVIRHFLNIKSVHVEFLVNFHTHSTGILLELHIHYII